MERKTITRKISKRPLYRDEIKEVLMDAIVSGELKPGDRIVETRWARELGVSQSPIREALRELEMIGLVENIPYKGSIVCELRHKDLIDTLRVRIALETLAVMDAANADIDDMIPAMEESLNGMISCAEKDDVKGFSYNDAKFHETFVEHSDNEVLKRLWRQCYISDNTSMSTIMLNTSLMELAKRHEILCEAIKSKNERKAREEIESHFNMLINSLNELDEE